MNDDEINYRVYRHVLEQGAPTTVREAIQASFEILLDVGITPQAYNLARELVRALDEGGYAAFLNCTEPDSEHEHATQALGALAAALTLWERRQ